MLVLSRIAGESIVIAESMRVTVTVIGNDFADLSLSHLDGNTRIGVATLSIQKPHPIYEGVRAIMIQRTENRVRLGFDYDAGIEIRRDESK